MVLRIFLVMFSVGAFLNGNSQRTSKSQLNNFERTQKLYDELIATDEPNIAMLNLFFTNMPKGGDIHHHYSGTIYAETFLDWVRLKSWKIDSCTLEIISEGSNSKKCKSLTVDQVRGNKSLYRRLLSLWSDKDFSNHDHEQLPPDLNFFNTFGYFGPISHRFDSLGLQIIKQRALSENVVYIETMLAPVGISGKNFFSVSARSKINTNLKQEKDQKLLDQLFSQIIDQYEGNPEFEKELNDFVSSVARNHGSIDTKDFTLRYQTYSVRVLDPLQVFTDLYTGFLAAKKSPLIVGVNIVAPENNITALEDYSLHMKMYNFLSRKYPKVNRALHAGELTLGMVRPKDLLFHIEEAVDVARAQRIGHGIDIAYEQNSFSTLNKMRNKIAVEINLTSNQFILGVEGKEHPFLIYSKYDVPVVISTDDSGVSRNNLTREYVLLASRYKPTYPEIKEYVYNSIKYSFLQEDEKDRCIKLLDKKFSLFEREIADFHFKLN